MALPPAGRGARIQFVSSRDLADQRWQTFLASWGEELRQARLARGLTVDELAHICNLGERLTGRDIEWLERAPLRLSDIDDLIALTEALELGALVVLAPMQETLALSL